jgi:hypothetical protein
MKMFSQGHKNIMDSLECLKHSSQNFRQKNRTLYSHVVYNIANQLSQLITKFGKIGFVSITATLINN